MTSDSPPEPEPRGQRVPPPRYPPTAVGVATPPPPRRRPDGYVDRPRIMRRRLAVGFVATALTGTGLGVASATGHLLLAGASVGAAAALGLLALWLLRVRARRAVHAAGPRRYGRTRRTGRADAA